MNGLTGTLRPRAVMALALSAVALGYLVLSPGAADTAPQLDDDEDDAVEESKMQVVWVSSLELSPGAATIVQLSGLDEDDRGPLSAQLKTAAGKLTVPVLHRDGSRVVVQIPRGLEPGPTKLRLLQGERRSKPIHLLVRRAPASDVLRDLIGGLALFVLGLRTLGQSLRVYAGQRVRAVLAMLTQDRLRSTALGAMVGGLTQSTTSSAGLLAGLLDARMLLVPTAIAMLLGAQLGAATAGAVLPLVATREALWVIALGVMWVGVSDNRPARAAAGILLGCGLLFLGLGLLHAGFRPLLADPELLPYLHVLRADRVSGMLLCALAGALLCAVLQGPGPVFALVLSLASSSGLIGLSDGLAMLAGTSSGAALGTLGVGWRLGREGRRLAAGHALFGLAMTAVGLLGLPLFVHAADALVAGDPRAVDYAAKTFHPLLGLHLFAGFWLSQFAGAALVLALMRPIARLAERWVPGALRIAGPAAGAHIAALSPALQACRSALSSVREVTVTRDRGPAVAAERSLVEARASIDAVLRTALRTSTSARNPELVATAGACIHVVTATDAALRVAERGLELDFELRPQDAATVDGLYALLEEGLLGLRAHVEQRASLQLSDARAREIRLNALEAEARRLPSAVDEEAVPYRLWVSELVAAYEAIGNQLYRVAVLLADDGSDALT